MHIVYIHELSSLHTYSPGRFLTTLHLHVQLLDALFLLCRFDETIHIARSLSLSLIMVFSSLLSSYYFLILPLSYSVVTFFPLFICYHCVKFTCIIAVILILVSIYTLFQVTLSLACIRGVFSSRIYVTDSRRDSVFTYFGRA